MSQIDLERELLVGKDPPIYEDAQPIARHNRIVKEVLKGAVVGLLNPHTAIVFIIAVGATFLSTPGMLDLKFDTWMKMLILGAVYPTVNTIKSSYDRREKALRWLASLKADIVGYVWILRSFAPGQHELVEVARRNGEKMLGHLQLWMEAETYDKQFHMKEAFRCVSNFSYILFCATSHSPVEGPSSTANAPGVVSRCNQFVRFIARDMEMMRTIRDYRTPVGLRMFAAFVLHMSCVALAPFFNSYCEEDEKYGCPGSYFTASMFTIVVLMLYHTQRDLEDPYDGIGLDDIRMSLVGREVGWGVRLPPPESVLEHEGLLPLQDQPPNGLTLNRDRDYDKRRDASAVSKFQTGFAWSKRDHHGDGK